MDWAPDENSLVAVAVGDAVRIKLLNLATGEWKTLATLDLPVQGPGIDVLGLVKTVSWSQ